MVGLGRRLLVAMVLLCLIVPVFMDSRAAEARRNQRAQEPVLDIASIALRPGDLDVEGFVIGGGQMYTLEDHAAENGITVEEVLDEGLGRTYFQSVGWRRTASPTASVRSSRPGSTRWATRTRPRRC